MEAWLIASEDPTPSDYHKVRVHIEFNQDLNSIETCRLIHITSCTEYNRWDISTVL